MLQVVKDFEDKGIKLISLRENIDISTVTGRCFLSIMGAIAQMERELKAERAAAGREAAKARGRTGGRQRTDPDKLQQARFTRTRKKRPRRFAGPWVSAVVHSSVTWQLRKSGYNPG